MACSIKCPKEEGCPYPVDNPVFYSNIREMTGYCPFADMYFDEEKQEAYELAKIPKGKRRMKNRQRR